MTTPPPEAPKPDPIVDPQQVQAAPFYWPNLIAALISAIAVAVGSIGPWISFMGMSRSNIGAGADGTITLVLGIIATLSLFALLNFGRTQVRSRRMVALGAVAAIAGLLAFLIGVVDANYLTARNTEVFGRTMGPDIGWGLWMILIAGPTLVVTSAIVVKQVRNIAKANAEPTAPRSWSKFRRTQSKPTQPPAPSTTPPPSVPTPPPLAPEPATRAFPSAQPPAPPVPTPPVPAATPSAPGPTPIPAARPAAVVPSPPAAPAPPPPPPEPLQRVPGGPTPPVAARPPGSGISARSGLRRAAPWAGGAAALTAAFAAGAFAGPHLIGDNQATGPATGATSTTTTTITTTAMAAPSVTPPSPESAPNGAPAGTFGPFDSGDAKVFVDGKPREVRGKVQCLQSADKFFLLIDPPGNQVTVTLSPDQSRVLTVNLGRVNGESIPTFLDGSERGDASVTKDGNTYRITGTVATGFSATSPTVPFEIDATCP